MLQLWEINSTKSKKAARMERLFIRKTLISLCGF